MLAILFLAGAALAGTCLIRRVLRGLLDGAEHILWGTVVGWTLATLGVYALALAQGRLSYALMTWATAAVWLAALLLLLLLSPSLRRPRVPGKLAAASVARVLRPHYLGLAVVLLLFAPVYWRLFSTHTFAHGDGGIYSAGSAWYDLSFHAALTSSFLYGENFPPAYTLLPPEALLYPFMPDFLTAALMAAGLGLRSALLVTELPLALLITGLFYTFALRITRSQRAAILATALFLLNGGLGFVELLRDWRASGKGFLNFWSALSVNYANAWERGLHWANLIVDTFLPQRASLFGLPLALMIFTIFAAVWHRSHGEAERNGSGAGGKDDAGDALGTHGKGSTNGVWGKSVKGDAGATTSTTTLMLTAGVLAGLLPLFHTHTYIAVGFVSGCLFILRPRRAWLVFWTPAVLLAAPHLLNIFQHAAAGSFIRLHFGWIWDGKSSFPVYMLRNFGLPLLLAVPAFFAAPRIWRKFYLAFALLFAFSFTVVVSPSAYDNGKLTYYWHALNSVFVAAWLVRLAAARRARPLAVTLAALIILACVATGIAALQGESLLRARLFTDEELDAASFARAHTPPHALFLTAPVTNQPVMCLAGRPVVRGVTSWLWSHGYEFREREADVRRIYAGLPDALELLRYYGVDYVYLGDAERQDLKADARFFDERFLVVYRGASITIYDARAGQTDRADRADGRRLPKAPAPRELAARVGRDPYALLAEFPRASFFVYRLYKAAHGRMPRMREFMEAMRVVGRGLYVGTPGWERRLEANRQALVEGWAAREEVRAAYDGATNAEFVEAILRNAGLDAEGRERAALVRRLDSGEETRMGVLLRVVEDGKFYAREHDTAFVLIHFFGYLGRDPGDAPDRDFDGFLFWRGILASSGDYQNLSRAFLESGEYKDRPLAP